MSDNKDFTFRNIDLKPVYGNIQKLSLQDVFTMLTITQPANQILSLQLIRVGHKSPTKPNREPVDKLSDGDKADSKAKSTDPSKAGDEVQPGHLGGSLILWVNAQEQFFSSTI